MGAQLDLLQNNGAAHLLSEPSILCTNNKEAEIYVGQTRSILTAAQQSATGVSNVLNNYSREDIGLTLKVQPRLSSNNQVTLEIETILEDIDPSTEQVADRPTTTKRKVKTNAIVNNGETIILGGLIKKVGGKAQSKVPYFGEIPVLGELLFTSNSDVESEQNVVIYLTPYIVRKSGDLQKLKKILAELDEVQARYNQFVAKNLEKSNVRPFDSKGNASGRIRQTEVSYRPSSPVVTESKTMGSRGPMYVTEQPASQTYQEEQKPVNRSSASSRITNSEKKVVTEESKSASEEEGFFASLFSTENTSDDQTSKERGSRGYYEPSFGER